MYSATLMLIHLTAFSNFLTTMADLENTQLQLFFKQNALASNKNIAALFCIKGNKNNFLVDMGFYS